MLVAGCSCEKRGRAIGRDAGVAIRRTRWEPALAMPRRVMISYRGVRNLQNSVRSRSAADGSK